MSTYRQYLDTLRRVPDDIILSVATREMDMGDGETCLCGWFVKEQVGRILNVDPADVDPYDDAPDATAFAPNDKAWQLFGGDDLDWYRLYNNAAWDTDVERAFVARVLEAVA